MDRPEFVQAIGQVGPVGESRYGMYGCMPVLGRCTRSGDAPVRHRDRRVPDLPLAGAVGAFALTASGHVFAALPSGVHRIDFAISEAVLIDRPESESFNNRPNEARFLQAAASLRSDRWTIGRYANPPARFNLSTQRAVAVSSQTVFA